MFEDVRCTPGKVLRGGQGQNSGFCTLPRKGIPRACPQEALGLQGGAHSPGWGEDMESAELGNRASGPFPRQICRSGSWNAALSPATHGRGLGEARASLSWGRAQLQEDAVSSTRTVARRVTWRGSWKGNAGSNGWDRPPPGGQGRGSASTASTTQRLQGCP